MDLKRALGLALCAVAFALVAWGLFFAKIPGGTVAIKIDLPPAEAPPPKPKPAAKPLTIAVDGSGKVSIREGEPQDRSAAEPAPNAKR